MSDDEGHMPFDYGRSAEAYAEAHAEVQKLKLEVQRLEIELRAKQDLLTSARQYREAVKKTHMNHLDRITGGFGDS